MGEYIVCDFKDIHELLTTIAYTIHGNRIYVMKMEKREEEGYLYFMYYGNSKELLRAYDKNNYQGIYMYDMDKRKLIKCKHEDYNARDLFVYFGQVKKWSVKKDGEK